MSDVHPNRSDETAQPTGETGPPEAQDAADAEPTAAPDPAPESEETPDSARASESEPVPAAEPADTEQATASSRPKRLIFRITRVALLAVIVFTLCATPFAWAAPWLLTFYLVPLLLLAWVLRVRTVVTEDAISARTLVRTTTIPWDDVKSLRLREKHWVRAVRQDGSEVTLPPVRVRDIPALASLSGGRLSDPTATPVPEDEVTDERGD